MLYFEVILVLLSGLIFGSFISSLTWRLAKDVPLFKKHRSICPKCKKDIVWYDNIPIVSYVFLLARCRKCKKSIPLRYPLIESTTALGLLAVWVFYHLCSTPLGSLGFSGDICWWVSSLGSLSLPFLFFIFIIFFSILITDLEEQIIPDVLVFVGYGVLVLILFIIHPPDFYLFFVSGFGLALFLLILNVVTKGKGMGLGDVKLALLGGTLLGWPLSLVWIFMSFVLGALVGLILIIVGKAKFGKQIAFGPFMVLALFLTLIYGTEILRWLGLI